MHFDGDKVWRRSLSVQNVLFLVICGTFISLLSVYISAVATQQRLTANSARKQAMSGKSVILYSSAETLEFCLSPFFVGLYTT